MKILCLATLICLGIVLWSANQVTGLEANIISNFTCLDLKSKNKVPVHRLKSYIVQTTPIHAILFTTKKNKHTCADPKMDWVKKAMEQLNKKKRAQTPEKKRKTKKQQKKKNDKKKSVKQ
ncbi:C-C motif chemokine 2 [Bombina bombina]|uniref:C-C motif chemokine 2 n=1 Tax=Bombina bombina TaxID=8345 RepID=UPI00235B1649|nr:C-C motif chemokine 2 [Bombina bombina]